MRRRLLLSTLAVTSIAVLLLGIPLAFVIPRLIYEENEQQLEQEATAIAADLDTRTISAAPIDTNRLTRAYPDRSITIQPPHDAPPVTAGMPAEDGMLSEQAMTEGGTEVTVSRSSEEIREEVASSLLLVLSLALLAVGVAVGLAVLMARRLTLPLMDLAITAERLGSGAAEPVGHRYGVVELDQVAQGLDRSAERLSSLIAAERDFATDASHQLRTPLTALSMRLEEIIAEAGDNEVVREEAEAALAQSERLAAVVEHLLGRARRAQEQAAAPVAIDPVLEQILSDWEPVYRRAGRELRLVGEEGLVAVTSEDGLSQILTTFADNGFRHGDGTVTVQTSSTDGSVVIEFSDEGEGVSEELAGRIFERHVSGHGGTGLGLALARRTAEADGGRVELLRRRPAVFAVFLRRQGAGATGDGEDPGLTGPT
ncbi:ATP-binding protein [Allonocardiopsis opalescens]|uniref:Signal transduction histidine-protein kinase/phosphatase MprB n=1 Tax=Allonocardiopsis opalescens TaxID=1144618 RepID=A0A2T0QC06_9ACTN|nr:ATP-binding protein [Allonocardiopsis opalescens]PRY01442.1 signal transduction histidine kinase [Allonocardiopsis opalescens]